MGDVAEHSNWLHSDKLTYARIDDLCFCLEHRTVEISGVEIHFTTKEFDLFALLLLNPKRVFTYERIAELERI